MAVAYTAHAQTAVPSNLRASLTIDRISTQNGIQTTGDLLFGIPLPPAQVEGNSYLNTQWATGNIVLYGQERTFKNLQVRYDLAADGLEVKLKESVNFVAAEKVKALSILVESGSREFINTKELSLKNKGLLEVLADGEVSLLKRTTVYLRQADYRPELGIGHPNHKLIHKTEYYLKIKDELRPLNQRPSRWRKQLITWGMLQKHESVAVADEAALVQILTQYNANATNKP